METKIFLKTVGDKVRLLRKAQGISQETLAELSGLHVSFISYVETGKTNARISTLKKICDILKVELGILVRSAY